MNTPICDFVKQFVNSNPHRLHMPGHKGKFFLNNELYDITEIDGADSLYEADGIIKESESNASEIFGAVTLYSTEGSSQCIKAMLHLICTKAEEKPLIWAGRNAHKSFLSAAVLSDFEIKWLYPANNSSYLSCKIDENIIRNELKNSDRKPDAVYITSPDYLGNTCDIKALSEVCHENGILLLVDNAHGSYQKFLSESLHPIDLGADMCTDSAHKTLPVLTGGAYLHISKKTSPVFASKAKNALSLFGSTSPSYLILQSLDMANKTLSETFRDDILQICERIKQIKSELKQQGFSLIDDELLKITIETKKYGYYGYEIAEKLKNENIFCEFHDEDFIVLMPSAYTDKETLDLLKKVLCNIERKKEITEIPPSVPKPDKVYSPRQAAFMPSETISAKESLGRILAFSTVGCPPAVPIIAGGERIDEDVIKCFNYYKVKECTVIK